MKDKVYIALFKDHLHSLNGMCEIVSVFQLVFVLCVWVHDGKASFSQTFALRSSLEQVI